MKNREKMRKSEVWSRNPTSKQEEKIIKKTNP